MQIAFHKLSHERHRLEIRRDDGHHEVVECEARSYLVHDLAHYAVESRARLGEAFWGSLALGGTLAVLNEQARHAMNAIAGPMAMVERLTGVLHGLSKGRSPEFQLAKLRRCAPSDGLPPWLTIELIMDVKADVEQLMRSWNATAVGGTLELEWP